MSQRMLSIGQAAQLLNVSIKTLREWDRTSLLKAYRTPNGGAI